MKKKKRRQKHKEQIQRGSLVTTTKTVQITDPAVEQIYINSRRITVNSIVDSPVHLGKSNKLWLVKHQKSHLRRGVPHSYYAVYHEDELTVQPEIISRVLEKWVINGELKTRIVTY